MFVNPNETETSSERMRYLKRFIIGFSLTLKQKKGGAGGLFGGGEPGPEGLAIGSGTRTGGYSSKWSLRLPGKTDEETFCPYRSHWSVQREWATQIFENPEYTNITLYRAVDYHNQGYILVDAPDMEEDSYILEVKLNLRWGADYYKSKGHLPIPYLRLVYLFLNSVSSQIELRDSDNEIPTADPPGFLLNLYDYQSRTLTWMRRIESGDLRIRYHKEYYHPLPDPDTLDYFCYVSSRDVEETAKTLALYQCYADPPAIFREFPLHGGLLADIMGNGKTVTGIAHICSQRNLSGYSTYPRLKRGLEEDAYLPSRATLILCPNNIIDQWYSEFEKCLGSAIGRSYSIIKLGNIRHLKSVSHWDLINADVVIASYGLLSNPNHVGKGFVQKCGLSRHLTEHRTAKLNIPELTESPDTWNCSVYEELAEQLPSKRLYLYKWHRIIHDEFHEVIDVKIRTNCLLLLIRYALRATYYWGFSGTPILERETVLENLPHLLQFQDDWDEILPMKNGNKELFFDKCVIKNIKRQLPPLKYKTVSILGTAQEKQLYETLRASTTESERLVRFACYHNLGASTGSARSLLSAESVMANEAQERERLIQSLNNTIKDTEICLASSETSLKSLSSLPRHPFSENWQKPQDLFFLCDSGDKKHNVKVRVALETDAGLRRARDLLREYKKETKSLLNLQQEKQRLEKANILYEKFRQNRTMSCSLCSKEDKCDGFLSLPECRHSACSECMDLMREGSQRLCPICRKTPFDSAKLAQLAGQESLKEQTLSKAGLNRTLWGSKICSVVDTLVSLDKEDKVLIFAQWSDLLDQLSVALAEVGIQCCSVEGTTSSRAAAIKKFQKDPECRVILLSSVHGTSGINLVEGNHVFIIHHFLGSSGKEYEYQAICRAYRAGQKRTVTVTHFIREDTLELSLHQSRSYTDEAGNQKAMPVNAEPKPLLPKGTRLTPLIKPKISPKMTDTGVDLAPGKPLAQPLVQPLVQPLKPKRLPRLPVRGRPKKVD